MIEGMVQIPLWRRRIIKRPRLTRILDEANAPLVLLVAPAGYGKTTLARQWLAQGKRRHAWYTGTPPSSDVSALALGLARALETIVPGPAERMRQRLLAVPTSEEEPEVVADILADSASEWPDDAWLIVDDYHHIGVSAAAEAFFARFVRMSGVRLFVTSRTEPTWASARSTTYGEVAALGIGELALTATESALVLGVKRDHALDRLLERTQGWPVVTSLAAVTHGSVPQLPTAEALYDFLASEVFAAASQPTRRLVCQLAFLSSPTLDVARSFTEPNSTEECVTEAAKLGLLEREASELRLHPLFRDFLKARFAEFAPDERAEALRLLTVHLEGVRAWDDLFEVVKQDPTPLRLDALLSASLRDLVAEGRVGTLSTWYTFARSRRLQTPAIQLAVAELSFLGGNPLTALPLAVGSARGLATESLSSRAWILAGRSAYFLDRYPEAVEHFEQARDAAQIDEDRLDAAWGHFLAMKCIEDLDTEAALATLAPVSANGLDGVLRYANARMALAERASNAKDALSEALPLLGLAEEARDVGIKTSFLNSVGRALVDQARYDEALAIFRDLLDMTESLGLRHILPDAWIGIALAENGLRRFGRASKACDRAEAEARKCNDAHNLVECQLLRIRILIALGAAHDATKVGDIWQRKPGSAALGELAGCRALAHACCSEFAIAEALVEEASRCIAVRQTRVLCGCTELIIAMGRSGPFEPARDTILDLVSESGSLDGVVTAIRGFPPSLAALCSNSICESEIVGALSRSRDFRILKETGLRLRGGESQPPFLTPREEDVFGLLCQGLSNGEIARSLFISGATVKVHLRHVYQKLGVSNRREALARSAVVIGEQKPRPR